MKFVNTILKFGTGRFFVGAKKDEESVAIVYIVDTEKDNPELFGGYISEEMRGKHDLVNKNTIILKFDKIESIDVFIEAFTTARKFLVHNNCKATISNELKEEIKL